MFGQLHAWQIVCISSNLGLDLVIGLKHLWLPRWKMYRRLVTLLIFLDLSRFFDTINYDILLDQLSGLEFFIINIYYQEISQHFNLTVYLQMKRNEYTETNIDRHTVL